MFRKSYQKLYFWEGPGNYQSANLKDCDINGNFFIFMGLVLKCMCWNTFIHFRAELTYLSQKSKQTKTRKYFNPVSSYIWLDMYQARIQLLYWRRFKIFTLWWIKSSQVLLNVSNFIQIHLSVKYSPYMKQFDKRIFY